MTTPNNRRRRRPLSEMRAVAAALDEYKQSIGVLAKGVSTIEERQRSYTKAQQEGARATDKLRRSTTGLGAAFRQGILPGLTFSTVMGGLGNNIQNAAIGGTSLSNVFLSVLAVMDALISPISNVLEVLSRAILEFSSGKQALIGFGIAGIILIPIFAKVAGAAKGLWLALAASPLGALVVLIAAVGAGLYILASRIDDLQGPFIAQFNHLAELFESVYNWVINIGNAIVKYISNPLRRSLGQAEIGLAPHISLPRLTPESSFFAPPGQGFGLTPLERQIIDLPGSGFSAPSGSRGNVTHNTYNGVPESALQSYFEASIDRPETRVQLANGG